MEKEIEQFFAVHTKKFDELACYKLGFLKFLEL